MEDTQPILVNSALLGPGTDVKPWSPVNLTTKDYIPFGSDNLFPQALALFSRTSPNHRGVINSKNVYLGGKGFASPKKDTWLIDNFIEKCNYEGESLDEVQRKFFLDENSTGNVWIELITDRNRSFLWVNHLDSTKARKSKDTDEIILHPDWYRDTGISDKHRRRLPLYPNFKPDSEDGFSALRCVYHKFNYEPEFTNYGIPWWLAGKDSVQIDLKTGKWNLARLINAFRLSGIMFVPVKDAEESKTVIKKLRDDYTGEGNQDKLLVVTKSRASQSEKADQVQLVNNKTEDEGSWLKLHEMSVSDIIVAHSWYRALSGIVDNSGFDTQRILNEYNVALSTYIQPKQEEWTKLYVKLFREVINRDIELTVNNSPPVDTDDGMFLWELRKQKGLDYNENDVKQQKIIYNGSLFD